MAKSSKRSSYGNSKIWDTGFAVVEECEHIDKTLDIHIPLEIYNKIKALEEATDGEWMGYFTGIREDTDAYIDDIIIPEQTASGATCENTEPVGDTIGIIHSHGNIGAHHSHRDNDSAIHQNGFSIVVDSDMEFDVVGRVDLPCDKKGKVDAEIHLVTDKDEDYSEWAEEQKENIKKKYKSYKKASVGTGSYRGYVRAYNKRRSKKKKKKVAVRKAHRGLSEETIWDDDEELDEDWWHGRDKEEDEEDDLKEKYPMVHNALG